VSLWRLGSDAVLGLRLVEPAFGEWAGLVEIDADTAPADGSPVVLQHAAEGGAVTEWRGTVVEALPHLGRVELYVVGGAGGLRRPLAPRYYQAAATPQLLVEDILREAGEARPPAADLTGLAGRAPLASWTRPATTGGGALSALCRAIGVGWRMRRDGTVRVGPVEWRGHTGADPLVESIRGGQGLAIAAPARPDLEPGTLLDGRRVERLTHTLESGRYRVELRLGTP